MPLAGKEVAAEIKSVCIPQEKCKNLNDWLNKLYRFRVNYHIYKFELERN